jgi:hypothetical protein
MNNTKNVRYVSVKLELDISILLISISLRIKSSEM